MRRLGWGERGKGERGGREGMKGGDDLRWREGREEGKRWHGMACGRGRGGVGVMGVKTRFSFFFSFYKKKKKAGSNEYEEKERRNETSERKYGGSWKTRV